MRRFHAIGFNECFTGFFALRLGRGKSLYRMNHVGPEKVSHHHEDERVDRGRGEGGLP